MDNCNTKRTYTAKEIVGLARAHAWVLLAQEYPTKVSVFNKLLKNIVDDVNAEIKKRVSDCDYSRVFLDVLNFEDKIENLNRRLRVKWADRLKNIKNRVVERLTVDIKKWERLYKIFGATDDLYEDTNSHERTSPEASCSVNETKRVSGSPITPRNSKDFHSDKFNIRFKSFPKIKKIDESSSAIAKVSNGGKENRQKVTFKRQENDNCETGKNSAPDRKRGDDDIDGNKLAKRQCANKPKISAYREVDVRDCIKQIFRIRNETSKIKRTATKRKHDNVNYKDGKYSRFKRKRADDDISGTKLPKKLCVNGPKVV